MLNQDQQRIHDEAIATIRKEDQQVYEYEGKAGTGKTYLMHQICRDLGISMENILPMAYTGAAASVLRKKGFPTATTLHNGLYDPREIPNPAYEKAMKNPQFGVPDIPKTIIIFEPKTVLPGKSLIVIDEGYMCPDYMREIIESFGIPILVTGDRHQLPPIQAKPAYLWKDNLPSLTQIMRQEENNPIVYIANEILEDRPIHAGMYGNRVLVIDDSCLTDSMLMHANLVLCGRNATRDEYNQYLRAKFGFSGTLPNYGERVICRKNNHNIDVDGIELCNGLVGYCISQPYLYNKQSFYMDFLPDISYSPFRSLRCDYDYFTAPSKDRANYSNDPKNIHKEGERFEFAYCITTHLAQGSETSTGVYIREFLRRDMQKALDYTAVTRFKQSMIIVLPSKKYY